MLDSDELVSSRVLRAPTAAPRCDARTGALGLKVESFRPLPNLRPSLEGRALSSLLLSVAIEHLPKMKKAGLVSACLTSVCSLRIVRHCQLCGAYFPISSR